MRAIISVSDKAGVTNFAQGLSQLGFEVFSTGGTKKALAEAGVPVKSISEITGFPEILNGRVKTLHPAVHGGILAKRNLPEHMAELAKKRQYSETLIIEGNQKQIKSALATIAESGLSYTFGGKFYEVFQGGDKGKAVKILIELFKLNFGGIYTIGIGDSLNDVGMLEAMDLPILVQTEGNRWHGLKVKNLKRVKGVGPEGWSQAASELFIPEKPANKKAAKK